MSLKHVSTEQIKKALETGEIEPAILKELEAEGEDRDARREKARVNAAKKYPAAKCGQTVTADEFVEFFGPKTGMTREEAVALIGGEQVTWPDTLKFDPDAGKVSANGKKTGKYACEIVAIDDPAAHEIRYTSDLWQSFRTKEGHEAYKATKRAEANEGKEERDALMTEVKRQAEEQGISVEELLKQTREKIAVAKDEAEEDEQVDAEEIAALEESEDAAG